MVATNESALICDMAETYNIYDYKALPCRLVATLAVGLRDNSRIKMELSGQSVSLQTMLLAAIADRLSLLVWSKTSDAEKGINKPKMIVDCLDGNTTAELSDGFNSPEEFESQYRKLAGRR